MAGILVAVLAILAFVSLLFLIARRRKEAAVEESFSGEVEMVEGVSADGLSYIGHEGGGIFSGENPLGTGDAFFDGILLVDPHAMEEGLYA
jgi:hypothetical protein